MTISEAAKALGVTPDTLRQQIGRGRFKATKHGRDWWVTEAEVERYRAASRGQIGRRPSAEPKPARARKAAAT